MAKVNSLSLARSKDQPGAQDPNDRSTWIPRSTILGYPCAAVRENDRLDNDREVGIVLLDESDTREDQPPAKTSDNEGDRVA